MKTLILIILNVPVNIIISVQHKVVCIGVQAKRQPAFVFEISLLVLEELEDLT